MRVNNIDKLTVKEVEFLCRQYIECRLSVAEETELEYVLSRSRLNTPLISETRQLMGLSRLVDIEAEPQIHYRPKILKRVVSIAACIAIFMGIGFTALFHGARHGDDFTCIARVGGRLLKGSDALQFAEATRLKAECIINENIIIEMKQISDFEITRYENNINQLNMQL